MAVVWRVVVVLACMIQASPDKKRSALFSVELAVDSVSAVLPFLEFDRCDRRFFCVVSVLIVTATRVVVDQK